MPFTAIMSFTAVMPFTPDHTQIQVTPRRRRLVFFAFHAFHALNAFQALARGCPLFRCGVDNTSNSFVIKWNERQCFAAIVSGVISNRVADPYFGNIAVLG